ncbi:unnamed protein product [Closterium sp. Yama58-4]|nr:unnamed protein product [Closterium sp. Yama58-4]
MSTAGPKCVNAFPKRALCKFVDSLTSRVIPTLDGTKRLTIGVYQIYQKFHRDLPATKQYAYGTSQKTASYPGPTIVARVGIDTTVTWENHLLDNTHMFTVDRTVMMGVKLPKKGIPIGKSALNRKTFPHWYLPNGTLIDNTHMFTVDRTVMMGVKLFKKGIPIGKEHIS